MSSLKGHLLIAAPSLVDPNFCRTVVLVADHEDKGAFGLVLNRSSATTVSDLWAAISSDGCDYNGRAFVGGPVQQNTVLLLHGFSDLAREADPVIPGVWVGSEVEVFGELIRLHSGEELGAVEELPKFRVFCGYSGWAAGQLDSELKAGGWLTMPATPELVFHTPPEKLWQVTLESMGGMYRLFSMMPGNPEEN